MSELKLTRRELYDRVWATPVDRLAVELSLSGRGLGKLCERHNIPVPPRGWWAKKAAGKRVKQEPLSPMPTDEKKTIVLDRQPRSTEVPAAEEAPVPPEIAFERDPANKILVEESARINHPLLKGAATTLRGAYTDSDGIVHPPKDCVDARVSKASISRTLRILQALFVALERRGYTVGVKEGKTLVTVLGESFRIYVREQLKQTIRDLTPDEHRRRREGLWTSSPYTLVPRGELAFYIGDSYPRKTTADGKKQRLEESLNAFVEKLVREALAEKDQRAQRAREEEERQKAEERRRVEENRNRHELAKRERFDDLVEFWRLHEERRAFFSTLRSAIGDVPSDSPLGEWLQWAESYVAIADPLSRFRERAETIKLYYLTYESAIERIRSEGFRDPAPPPSYSQQKAPPPGVLLRDRPSGELWGEAALELELPEDLVLPFEVTKPGFLPRTFYVPADVLNTHLQISNAPE